MIMRARGADDDERDTRDQDALELALLANLQAQRDELRALLDRTSNHWGYEDPVYRFYHQSFKVFTAL